MFQDIVMLRVSYMIQGTELKSLVTSTYPEQVEAMYQEGNAEGFVDQSLYYPSATNYGYYFTGFESPSEWEDHMSFGVDGSGVQYAGVQTESLPYLYHTPSYGYAESGYYPYNVYIPATTAGVDGPFVEPHHYYAYPQFQDTMSGSGYFPIIQPDIIPNSSMAPLLDAGVTFATEPVGRSSPHGLNSSPEVVLPRNPLKPSMRQSNFLTRISGGTRAHVGSSKQSLTHRSTPSIGNINEASSHLLQSGNASRSLYGGDNSSKEKVSLHSKQSKVVLSSKSGLSDFESSANKRISVETGLPSMVNVGRNLNDTNGNLNVLGKQHQGPKTNELRNQLVVKDYTAKMGGDNVHGRIIIYTDQYNRDDFFVNYVNAKFFVIKSYSEDDVHKSIKYNVWSSTHLGNKKLQSAYEDAQKISAGKAGGCSIFLFFSVNASGQFCGVAEMIGPVDFHKDMDFWQQEKWSGSFRVKWHIIKDVPNSRFRHIILVNNENKPVTNSRDTQEIMSKQGVEMLKIFKDHPSKTSVFDDFMFYESREKIMREQKARLAFKSFQAPVSVPVVASHPIQRQDSLVVLTPDKYEKAMKRKETHSLKKTEVTASMQPSGASDRCGNSSENAENSRVKSENDVESALEISPTDGTDQKDDASDESLLNAAASLAISVPCGIVTVGSMPVKVHGFA